MNIALDYDGTYTADPELWNEFIARCKERGHLVIVVTMRYPHPNEAIDVPCEVFYTSRKAKIKAFDQRGFIWIDDNPRWLFQDAA